MRFLILALALTACADDGVDQPCDMSVSMCMAAYDSAENYCYRKIVVCDHAGDQPLDPCIKDTVVELCANANGCDNPEYDWTELNQCNNTLPASCDTLTACKL